MSRLTKTGHRAEYCPNNCSKCPPFARTHARKRQRHSTTALSMMVWSMTNIQKTLLRFTTLD